MAAMQRAARAAERMRLREVRERERLRIRHERERVADAKEQVRLFHESKEEEAKELNEELEESLRELSDLLSDALRHSHRLQFEKLKTPLICAEFEAGDLGKPELSPRPEQFLPKPLGFLRRLIPGARARHAIAIRESRLRYDREVAAHNEREETREIALERARSEHQKQLQKLREDAAKQHAEVDRLRTEYEAGNREGVRQYCDAVLAAELYPDKWPHSFRVAFTLESKQLVVEYDYPDFEIVPKVASYRYVKTKKEILTAQRSDFDRRRLYTSIIAQTTLRVIYTIFNADYCKHLQTVAFNGHVDTIDPASGHSVHPCLVTLRTTRDLFDQLDLRRVDPESCLKGLNASVSKHPTELAPVKPVLEFSMVDPRFVEEQDVLSGLDNRTNLMDLNPREFESLITNLFEKMGLETRQTRPSRDGGVDCVAYDPRPIFGGKVVIQAKRYKNTVGVSAVRDLFGTVQNEGASKGILVTTSGFGKSSFEFANGKPLELLAGSNLLYLLAEHAGLEAKIEIPEDWKDPGADLPDNG
jgi:restriction system protein